MKYLNNKDFAQVYIELNVILSNLPEYERNKILERILNEINKYKSNKFTYKYDYSKSLNVQEMLPLTRLMLCNIYKKYLN